MDPPEQPVGQLLVRVADYNLSSIICNDMSSQECPPRHPAPATLMSGEAEPEPKPAPGVGGGGEERGGLPRGPSATPATATPEGRS